MTLPSHSSIRPSPARGGDVTNSSSILLRMLLISKNAILSYVTFVSNSGRSGITGFINKIEKEICFDPGRGHVRLTGGVRACFGRAPPFCDPPIAFDPERVEDESAGSRKKFILFTLVRRRVRNHQGFCSVGCRQIASEGPRLFPPDPVGTQKRKRLAAAVKSGIHRRTKTTIFFCS